LRRAGCLSINDSAMDDILIIILLILLNGVFSMAEIAMISARKSRLTSDARQGSRGASTALKLADDPDKFLSTIQIGITLIGILTGLYSGAALAEDVGKLLQHTGLQPHTARITGQVLIVAIVTYLSTGYIGWFPFITSFSVMKIT